MGVVEIASAVGFEYPFNCLELRSGSVDVVHPGCADVFLVDPW